MSCLKIQFSWLKPIVGVKTRHLLSIPLLSKASALVFRLTVYEILLREQEGKSEIP